MHKGIEMTYNDNDNNNKIVKMYIPSHPIALFKQMSSMKGHHFLRYCDLFLGSCLLISSSMLLVLSIRRFLIIEFN